MPDYKVEVTRDGRWWMVHVPEIDGLTQARRIGEIEDMARSLVAVSTDARASDVSVHVVSVAVPGLGDIATQAHEITVARSRAAAAVEQAQEAAAAFTRDLTRAEVPVRDVAELLGVSPQRASQLART